MKVYEIATIKNSDEHIEYIGTNFDKALEVKERELSAYNRLSSFDKKRTEIECRVYSIDDDVNINDIDELTNALIECIGYDLF